MSPSQSLASTSNSTVDDLPESPNEPPTLVRVRFDSECILIPDPTPPSRMPRLIKKSYSLPLWKKKGPPAEGDAEKDAISPVIEENAISFTLPLPSFSRARSPTRHEHHHHQPLVSCIADHQHRRPRRPSEPIPLSPDIATIPLRSCCQSCYSILEESIKEGDAWQERFTRGARRLRSLSTDSVFQSKPSRRPVCQDIPGFDAMLNVDEVDSIIHKSAHASAGLNEGDPQLDTPEGEAEDEVGLLPSLSRHRKGSCTVEDDLPGNFHAKVTLINGSPHVIQDTQLTASPPASGHCASHSVPKTECVTIAKRCLEDTYPSPLVAHSMIDSPSLSSSTSSASTFSDLPQTPPSKFVPVPIPSKPQTSSFFATPPSSPAPITESPSFISSSLTTPTSSPQTQTRNSSNHYRSASSPSAHSPSSPGSSWRRPLMHMPRAGSFIKATAEVLKGVNTMGGGPPVAV